MLQTFDIRLFLDQYHRSSLGLYGIKCPKR